MSISRGWIQQLEPRCLLSVSGGASVTSGAIHDLQAISVPLAVAIDPAAQIAGTTFALTSLTPMAIRNAVDPLMAPVNLGTRAELIFGSSYVVGGSANPFSLRSSDGVERAFGSWDFQPSDPLTPERGLIALSDLKNTFEGIPNAIFMDVLFEAPNSGRFAGLEVRSFDDGTFATNAGGTLGGTNQAPVAQNDDATTAGGAPVAIAVLANDADEEGMLDPAGIVVTVAPLHGTVTVAEGVATYSPLAGYVGGDAFAYTVPDVRGAASAPATVTLTVVPNVGSAGPELTATIAGALPASSVGGEKVKTSQVVTITNPSAARVTSKLTLDLFVSQDTLFDVADVPLLTTKRKVTLKGHGSKALSLKIDKFPVLPTGDYHLLGRVTNAAGAASLASNSSTLTIVAPFIDLSASLIAPLPTLTSGKKGVASVAIENLGNVEGQGTIEITLSAKPLLDAEAPLVPVDTFVKKINLATGHRKVLKLKFATPAEVSADAFQLVGAITPQDFSDPNDLNNSF